MSDLTAKKKLKRAIKVWVGFSDGVPHKMKAELCLAAGEADYHVCSTRKQALKAYEDVRRCYLVIPPKARK